MKSRDQKESIVDVRVCVCVCILTAEPLQDTYFKNKKIHRVTCTTLLKRYIS